MGGASPAKGGFRIIGAHTDSPNLRIKPRPDVDADGYREGIADRTRLTRQWSLFLHEYPLVLSPFLMQPTYDWDYDARGVAQTHDLFRSAIYSVAINYLGLPAGVVPTGLIANRPAGVQLIGRRFREDLILDAMERIEDRVGVLTHALWEQGI